MKGIKLLVSGYEASGKSSLIAKINDALVFNCDKKAFELPIPSADYTNYKGMDNFIEFIEEKITVYENKFKKYPKTIVIDTITQLYNSMANYNDVNYKGFTIHKMNNVETAKLNQYLEDTIISNGVNVVIVAHTIVDEKTDRHVIPSQGNFNKIGSWLSIVNEAIFISKADNKLDIFLNSFKYPARSLLPDLPTKVSMDKFDINEHIEKLSSISEENISKFKL